VAPVSDDCFDPRARRRRVIGRLLSVPVGLVALGVGAWWWMIRMPGQSFRGQLPPLSSEEQALSAELRRDVTELAVTIGERNTRRPEGLDLAASFVDRELAKAGYDVQSTTLQAGGVACRSFAAERRGRRHPDDIVVVGAHYDSAVGSPGANDNGSGAAAVLALARRLAGSTPGRTLRLELWPNEEPPWFQHEGMGSLASARAARSRGERIVAMLSLETIGSYSDEEDSQRYPAPFDMFYPSTGDFVAFVGNTGSRALVHRLVGGFRERVAFPCEGAAAPSSIAGVGWSDHWSYWQQGYPAVMVTDTAPFRYRHYHTRNDLPEHMDFDRMARVVGGLRVLLESLTAGSGYAEE
jgi:hypothetical protein